MENAGNTVTEQGTPDMFAVAKKSDIDQAVQAIARLSMDSPEGIPADALQQIMKQAGMNKLAAELESKAKIANLDFEELAGRFLGKQTSKHTKAQYKTGIDTWKSFCQSQAVNPFEASSDMADIYSAELRAGGKSPNTINARIDAISSFYTFLVKREHLSKTPFMDITRAKHIETHAPIPTREKLIEAAPNTFGNQTHGQIHHAVMIMLATGCRIGALATMKIDKAGNWRATSKGKTHSGRITNKGIINVARAALASNPYTNTGMWKTRIHRTFKNAGITGGAHLCRHRFALDLYNATGNNTEAVRLALGHTNIAITTAYLSGMISE